MIPIICHRIHSSADKSTNCTLDSSIDCNYGNDISSESLYDKVNDVDSQTEMATAVEHLDIGNPDAHNSCRILEINLVEFGTMANFKPIRADTGDDNGFTILNSRIKPQCIIDDPHGTSDKTVVNQNAKAGTEDEFIESEVTDDVDVDPYDHINDIHLRNIKTDSIYGVPDGVEKKFEMLEEVVT